MSDQLDELHARAGLDLLHADTHLVVHDETSIPAGTLGPYVRVYTHTERPFDHPGNRLSGTSDTYVVRWYCHCIGPNDTSARAVAMRVRAALLDVRPVIAGRSCAPIRMESSLPPTPDETTGDLVVDLAVVYRLTTTS